MRCEKSKRLISEDLDGRLPERKRSRLEAHLGVCPDCRAYRAGLETIQIRSRRMAAEGPGPEYFAASLGRLRSALVAEAAAAPPVRKQTRHFAPQGRWAWAGAGSLLLAAGVLFFAVSRTRSPLEFFSLAFDKAVRTSLWQSARSRHADVAPFLADHVLPLESLTDDEVLDLDTALQSEISRAQGRI